MAISPAKANENSHAQRLARTLEQRADFQFQETSLSDAIALLGSQLKINLVLDTHGLDEAGLDTKSPVTIDLKQVPVKTGLRLLLRQHGLAYYLRENVLVVSTPEIIEEQLTTSVYEVSDLLDDGSGDALIETTKTLVAPESWEEWGGTGTIREFDGALIVSQTAVNHDRIVQLQSKLRAYLAGKPQKANEPSLRELFASKKLEMKFVKRPLNQVLKQIGSALATESYVDIWALDHMGLPPDRPFSVSLTGGNSLAELTAALNKIGLTILIDDNVLQITSKSEAEKRQSMVVYDVRDLAASPSGDETNYDYDSILDVILGAIAAESWDDVGGSGVVVAYRGALAVGQSTATHEKIAELLAKLRSTEEAKLTAVKAALQSTTTLQLNDVPLADVLEMLGKRHKLTFRIDQAACEKYALDQNPTVTCQLEDTDLSTALTILLRPIELTFVPYDNEIVITAPYDAAGRLLLEVHSVGEWISENTPAKKDKLLDLIVRSIASESWDEIGGPGSIRLFGDRLVVSQTYDVQEKIKTLLAQLRRVRRARLRQAN